VLARIAGLFSGRGYNLESLTVGSTTDLSISRITLVCKGDDTIIEQIKKQLNRLIDVIKVIDMTDKQSMDRELALIKVNAKPDKRGELFQIADVFRAKIMDLGATTLTLEITGTPQKINDFLLLMQSYNIIEVARSGVVSMERGRKIKDKSVKQGEVI